MAEIAMDDRNTYEISDWIKVYSAWDHLLKPEEIILERLKDKLQSMKMLDIGVGGGRTSNHFSELVGEYVGIDFDDNMIQACKKRFPNQAGNISFVTCDVRSMRIFNDAYFDFILFSFNGIDYLSHDDRLKAFREIARVAKNKGYFLFSTHNLNSLDRLFSIRRYRHLRRYKALYRYLLIRLFNKNIRSLKAERHTRVCDGVYHHTLKCLIISIWKNLGYYYYSTPEEQIKQLSEAGFKILNIYGERGKEINGKNELKKNTDYWLYYFCEI